MKNITLFSLIASLMILVSCGSGDDGENGISSDDITIKSEVIDKYGGIMKGLCHEIEISIKDIELKAPKFEVTEGDANVSGFKNKLKITPKSDGIIKVKISQDGKSGIIELKVISNLPVPEFTFYGNPNEKFTPDEKIMPGGVTLFNMDVIADKEFKDLFSTGSHYRFNGGKAILIFEDNEVSSVELVSSKFGPRIEMQSLRGQAKPGSKIVINIEKFGLENCENEFIEIPLSEEQKQYTFEFMTLEEITAPVEE